MGNKLVEEIYQEIRRRNSSVGTGSIPHSDELYKFVQSSMGIDPDLAKTIIQVLVNSHRVFSMEVTAEDKTHDVPPIEGYVSANLTDIRKLKNYFQNELMIEYEKQFNKRQMTHQIVKDIFPMMRSLNNTALGMVANKAIMLEEFEKLMEKRFEEYTEEWKEKRLDIELSHSNLNEQAALSQKAAEEKKQQAAHPARKTKMVRAVDSAKYDEFASRSRNYPLQRIIKIYGTNFFLQVNLRKYQFSYIEKLVKDGQLNKRSDLLMLKEMIQTVKSHAEQDAGLAGHEGELYALEKTVNHAIYFTGKPS
ncbi:MAG: hypothetical protein EPN93_02275 [Spirochaetes bacterium]|nr:MAG: hypothetical protein EPN93_02275 [Spirochaetota bacterium]